MNCMDTYLRRTRNRRKLILYAYLPFPNLLASLCCVRNRFCSIQQPVLLLSLLPTWAGPWCLVMLTGSPGLLCAWKPYSWETTYPAPVTLWLLTADWGLSSFLDSLYHCLLVIYIFTVMWMQFMGLHSWNEGEIYTLPHYRKRPLVKSPTLAELYQSRSSACLQLTLTTFLPTSALQMLQHYLNFLLFCKWGFGPLCRP